MKATVLSEKQKNKTLSGKIQKFKKVVKLKSPRTIFASSLPRDPFTGITLSEYDLIKFEEKLSKSFPYQPPPVFKWSDLKTLSKEERRTLKNERKNINPLRAHVLLGFNEVTKAMETMRASAIIIADDINPALLTKHFYDYCDRYKTPLIKVKNLRDILKKCFGFSSMAMALKNVPRETHLYEFYKFLVFKFPDGWAIERRRKESKAVVTENLNKNTIPDIEETKNETTKKEQIVETKNEATKEEEIVETKNETTKEEEILETKNETTQEEQIVETENETTRKEQIVETENEATKEEQIIQMEVDNEDENKKNDVYLYRSDKETRCFVPEVKKMENKTTAADFIAFRKEITQPFKYSNVYSQRLKLKKMKVNKKRNHKKR